MYEYVTGIRVYASPPWAGTRTYYYYYQENQLAAGMYPRCRPCILLPLALVHKQASILLDGLLWKVAYIWIDSSWMLADDEDRWLLAREARMVHALVLCKPLQFFMAARREGWLPTTPARSAQDCGDCALLMAASSSLVGRRERSWGATCGVVCGGFDG
uniref:Heterokaryon incompatibility domain-containing protein n=1 Tax=Triticum urartu TaxID=4572 RepID=A0A8R7PYI4_TRIUA